MVDVLIEVARDAVVLWAFWIGDPLLPMALVPLVWQLPGLVIALWCVRSLHMEGR